MIIINTVHRTHAHTRSPIGVMACDSHFRYAPLLQFSSDEHLQQPSTHRIMCFHLLVPLAPPALPSWPCGVHTGGWQGCVSNHGMITIDWAGHRLNCDLSVT